MPKKLFEKISSEEIDLAGDFIFEELFHKKGALLKSYVRFHFYADKITSSKEKAWRKSRKTTTCLTLNKDVVIEFITFEKAEDRSRPHGVRFILANIKSPKYYCDNEKSLYNIIETYKEKVTFSGFSLVYRILTNIGLALGGDVYPGRRLRDSKEVSVKVLEKNLGRNDEEREFSQASILHEIQLLKKIKHSKILQLLEVYEGSNSYQMVFEQIKGISLQSFLMGNPTCTAAFVRKVIGDVLRALEYLHKEGIVHRDVRAQNIILVRKKSVLDSEEALLMNFGRARSHDWVKGDLACSRLHEFTPGNAPPEVFRQDGQDGDGWSSAGDIYCVGLLLYQMIFGFAAFRGNSRREILEENKKGTPFFPEIPKGVSPRAFALTKKLLQLRPLDRPTATEALQDDFFNPGKFQTNDENLNPMDNSKKHLTSMRSNISKMMVSCINMTSINRHQPKKLFDRNWSGGLTRERSGMDFCPQIKVTFVD